jgi:hypothetical protein
VNGPAGAHSQDIRMGHERGVVGRWAFWRVALMATVRVWEASSGRLVHWGIRFGRAWRGRAMGNGWPVALMTEPCAWEAAVDGWCAPRGHQGLVVSVVVGRWAMAGQWRR